MTAKKILIVEDDAALLRGLKDNFQAQGYQVRTASDGEQGLEALLRDPPDLALLDVMLPKVNGYEMCRVARSWGLSTPILMLSAKSRVDDVLRGLAVGADEYMTKPFGLRELLAHARRLSQRGTPAEQQGRAGAAPGVLAPPPGLGVRQPSGAFDHTGQFPKRQSTGALQNAAAPARPLSSSERPMGIRQPAGPRVG